MTNIMQMEPKELDAAFAEMILKWKKIGVDEWKTTDGCIRTTAKLYMKQVVKDHIVPFRPTIYVDDFNKYVLPLVQGWGSDKRLRFYQELWKVVLPRITERSTEDLYFDGLAIADAVLHSTPEEFLRAVLIVEESERAEDERPTT